jgi:hypothetical protein
MEVVAHAQYDNGTKVKDTNVNKPVSDSESFAETLKHLSAARNYSCAALENSVPRYHGLSTGNADLWLEKFQRYAELKQWSDSIKALSFPLFLESSAQVWHDLLDHETKVNYSKLISQFSKEFTLSMAQRYVKLDQLSSRKQADDEQVEHYLVDIAQQCRELKIPADREVEYATSGLRPQLKAQVLIQIELLERQPTMADVRRFSQLLEGITLPHTHSAPAAAISATSNLCTSPTKEQLVAKIHALERRQPGTNGVKKRTIYDNSYNVKDIPSSKRVRPNQVNTPNCHWCGRTHAYGSCPAYGKMCTKCNKYNHFAAVCRSIKQTSSRVNCTSDQKSLNITDE